jgi:5-(carboxyamino)imidazole ribonucleotide synthase
MTKGSLPQLAAARGAPALAPVARLSPLPPGATIGILGGGQLGRMLAVAAARLGLKTHIYSDGRDACAFDVAHAHTIGDFDDLSAIEAFARHVDVVTYEFENVPLEAAAAAERAKPVRPGAKALQVAQDRLSEKDFINGLQIPLAPYRGVSSLAELESAYGFFVPGPAILKTRRLGYDGKGQVRIDEAGQLAAAFDELRQLPCVLEGVVKFAYEVSILVVRDQDGATRFYDPPRNTHEGGILKQSTVPAGLPASAVHQAKIIAKRLADGLGYIGVLGVELFYMGDGASEPFVVNEIAPRVHNSGHWTLDACAVSQFENHVRAVAGWPLGATARHSDAVMTNIIGPEAEAWPALARQAGAYDDGACLHLYGKGLARPGRKMGHLTRLAPLSPPKSD